MKMERPAVHWWEATPCGNGKIGALMYSNICTETILFNYEDLWLPVLERPQLPEMSGYLPEYRSLLEAGRCHEADRYWRDALKKEGWPDFAYINPGHPAFDLKIHQRFHQLFQNYERTLDMATGEARISWSTGGITYERTMFVSRADDMAVIRFRASCPEAVNVELELSEHVFRTGSYPVKCTRSELPLHSTRKSTADTLRIEGRYPDGSGYTGVARVYNRDGIGELTGNVLTVKGASELLVFIKIEKSNKPSDITLSFPEKDSYDRLLEEHKKIHTELFTRISLELTDRDEERTQSNEQLLHKAWRGETPAALYERLFYYGRYLLLSSTGRKLPPNLQGIWNGEYLPPWACAYTLDENLQMAHWQVMPGNLWELMEPYFRFVEDSVPEWEENAQKFYGCRGILAPLAQSDHRYVCENMPYLMVTCVAGWLVREFYNYYLYTKDEEFLLERALPLMEKAALFYLDFSYCNDDGIRTICPAVSPENNPVVDEEEYEPDLWLRASVNPTVDIAIFRELLRNLCEIYRKFDIKPEKCREYQEVLKTIPEYQVNEEGALCEWMHEAYGDHYAHRHISHLYPLFPGNEITEEQNPSLWKACMKALEKKTESGMDKMTCWGYIHMAHLFSRTGQADKAYNCLEYAVKGCTGNNFFMYIYGVGGMGIAESFSEGKSYADPVFQLDSNTGITSAITHMLADSQPDGISILNGLPQQWQRGAYKGVKCMGNIDLSLTWNLDSRKLSVELFSRENQTVKLKIPSWVKLVNGKELPENSNVIRQELYQGKSTKLMCSGYEDRREKQG